MDTTPPQGMVRTRVEVVPAAPSRPATKRAIELHLTDRATGETRVVQKTGEWEGGEFQDFYWDEGGGGCDCQRLDWMYGKGDWECGDDRVSLRIVDPATGAEIYSED